MKKTNVTQETYSKHFLDYIKKFENNGSREKDIKEIFSYSKKQNAHVVELGCAGGRDAVEILKYTSNYIGVDYVEEFITYAKQNVPQGIFLVEDLETYTPPLGTDIVVACASLLHSDKDTLKKLLTRIHAILPIGGLVRFSIKYSDDYEEKTERDDYGLRTFYYYNEETIREISSEFTIIFLRKETHTNKDWLEVLLQK